MTDFPTEEQHKLRKNLGQINHLVTECPSCHVNNFWTKSQEIGDDTFYWQLCASCGYSES